MFYFAAEFSSISKPRPLLFPWIPTLLPPRFDRCVRIWIPICLTIRNLAMASSKECCVPDCNTTRDDKIHLHCFPNPDKDPERFRDWLYNIGGDVLGLDNLHIYMYRRVCHKHFETKYHTWSNRLSPNAVPTLYLRGLSRKQPLMDITNVKGTTEDATKQPDLAFTSAAAVIDSVAGPSTVQPKTVTVAQQSAKIKMAKNRTSTMASKLIKLQKQRDSYATRLKKALKLSENQTFQKCLRKFTTLAALFTIMQFREISKKKMGRRFTKKEKLMALSLYKQGPRAYRWLSKIFILPSPATLSRLIGTAGIKPGINKKLFAQLKYRAGKMTDSENLCVLLFDEMAIAPHLAYNRGRDEIIGFVDQETKKIADHALVFMIRGVIKNYKQAIAYSFCSGTTGTNELKSLLKTVIEQLDICGFKVLATVCDQGATNVSAINQLIKETKENYLRQNKCHVTDTFEVNGKEIVPLFDPPHLIKGIRNNLLTKYLKCKIDGAMKVAKWDHLIKLYQENPTYKGLRLIKNLTEAHVNSKIIPKMKVKYATQIFSKTIATNMGYLSEKGILPMECKDTADVLLFFDDLFDSFNGSRDGSEKKTGKCLLAAVTPKSNHSIMWQKAKHVLSSMKFINQNGRESSVPSIHNWLRIVQNMEYLKNKIFNQYSFKSLWMRHFNQDPLENFFGCIRCQAGRNTNPTASGFEAAFTSLLVTNITNYSRGSNCEEDFCKAFDSMSSLFCKKDQETLEMSVQVDIEDINLEITDFETKKKDSRIIAQLCYVTGYVLRKAKKNIFKNCAQCQEHLYDFKNPNEYLLKREYFNFKRCLTYPSENLIILFSEMQDIINHILVKKSNIRQIKSYCKTLILMSTNFQFIKCEQHKTNLIDYLSDLTCRIFLFNWCKDINKIINGTMTKFDEKDEVKVLARVISNKRRKTKAH